MGLYISRTLPSPTQNEALTTGCDHLESSELRVPAPSCGRENTSACVVSSRLLACRLPVPQVFFFTFPPATGDKALLWARPYRTFHLEPPHFVSDVYDENFPAARMPDGRLDVSSKASLGLLIGSCPQHQSAAVILYQTGRPLPTFSRRLHYACARRLPSRIVRRTLRQI